MCIRDRAYINNVNAILQWADAGKEEQHKAELPPKVKASRAVISAFWQKNNKDLSADGGDTYAELTVKSIETVIGIIKNTIGISADDIFVDGGCGYNFMMAYIAQLTGCNVYGIEYVRTKVFMGMVSTIQAIKTKELTNYNSIAYIPWDMFLLDSLGPATIAIFFDEAFPRSLIEHICRVLLKTSTTLKGALFLNQASNPI